MSWLSGVFGLRSGDGGTVTAAKVLEHANADGTLDKMVAAAIPHVHAIEAFSEASATPLTGAQKRQSVLDQLKGAFLDELPIVGTALLHLAVEMAVVYAQSASQKK